MIAGTWTKLEWVSSDHEWRVELTDEGSEFELVCFGDEWTFSDTFYGTLDDAKAYAMDIVEGVAGAKAADTKRRVS